MAKPDADDAVVLRVLVRLVKRPEVWAVLGADTMVTQEQFVATLREAARRAEEPADAH